LKTNDSEILKTNMNLTPYHAKYIAYELTQRIASKVATVGFNDADNLDKITASLSDAQVDAAMPLCLLCARLSR
jgi:hypothetical protein